ncbi:MAG: NifB/NifX family molybdenum-iron cluster-binding protein [Sulfuricurvum sp.]|uniref:NifB/NifX family molybdenum-iron cluster-binding protein n=1 Tax=Sulfuricurvum sp. TaxID=2025608 RepID=UPI00262CB8A5|nr:NifB/NifX family molybdenum-iron cluster-binding protein [Sulfuricurvum sp.]MDD2368904.1 NifB/NifX family molybdenum-iron cluster-binding protein [Sulfuricurvum sp.]MDD5117558.1 NifB/NifX family molybdenum-iron cluster-binding protein [Sulfuricurvum sp.]
MIAIPVESDNGTPMSTKLFGNAKFFAMVEPSGKEYTIIPNEGCGNGIQTANYLLEQGASSALYGFLGDGPFHVMVRGGMDVYWLGKETMPLNKAIETALSESLVHVTTENAALYLDPGTAAGACECGCTHD